MNKKKILLLTTVSSMVAVVGTVIFANGGANHLDAFAVKADPTEYSFTFSESNTTVKAVGDNYVIYGTTPRGAKVGVVGRNNTAARFTFNGVSFKYFYLYDYNNLLSGAGAFGFSTITGFAISFSGGSVVFDGGRSYISDVVSGQEYKGLSTIPDYNPMFTMLVNGSVTISSLTIWYSC